MPRPRSNKGESMNEENTKMMAEWQERMDAWQRANELMWQSVQVMRGPDAEHPVVPVEFYRAYSTLITSAVAYALMDYIHHGVRLMAQNGATKEDMLQYVTATRDRASSDPEMRRLATEAAMRYEVTPILSERLMNFDMGDALAKLKANPHVHMEMVDLGAVVTPGDVDRPLRPEEMN